ncbi:MAG: GGDEF domain-containing protein [Syntrophaceae bacterium]|nr:MAG: GGDEF domain-containing protein [Syntrophaceae bacterium]
MCYFNQQAYFFGISLCKYNNLHRFLEKMKLTISRKLLLGYLFMALLTVLASAYALFSLQKLSRVAYNITNHHFVLMETSKKLMDILLAQESVEKKYLILKDPELEQIFWQRSNEFKEGLSRASKLKLDDKTINTVAQMDALQNRLRELFSEEILMVQNGQLREAQAISDTAGRATIDDMAVKLRDIQKNMDQAINDEMNLIAWQGSTAVNMTMGLGLLSLILGITLALIVTRNISKPLKQLQKATRFIAEGNLDHKIEARRDDEIGALAKSFAHMTKRLKVLEALNLDASPLTGLPGNMAIENRIEQLLAQGKSFSLCQVDLDNFKPFADKYGYAWGSEVIKEVANILSGYVSEAHMTGIFLGHIGGDDFVVIGDPDHVQSICKRLVIDFESRILRFYAPQDAQNGYFIGKNRQGIVQKFPLITITAAIVTDDGSRFKNPLDMARLVAELKEYAKMMPGSNYVTEEYVEKRKLSHPQNLQSTLEPNKC